MSTLGVKVASNEDVLSILSAETKRIAELFRNSSYAIPGTERVVSIREIPNDPSKKNTKTLKFAYAQVKSEPGAFEENVAAHTASMQAAFDQGCDVVQFPEMSIPHYCSLDLLNDRTFLKAQRAWLDEVVEYSKNTPGLTSVVGFVDVDWDKTRPGGRPWNYNSLAVIRDGEIIDVIHKKLLPNYSVFDEVRWYEPGTETKIIDINGVKVGFLICEDIWRDGYAIDPVQQLVDAGAEYLSHSAASPINIGKNSIRAELVKDITDTYNIPFGSVNMIGCYDGYEGDLPFDGRGLVRSADGEWLAMGAPFKEELLILDPFQAPKADIPELQPIQETFLSLISSVQSYFSRLDIATGTKQKAVVGNSGGIDSAVVLALLTLALGPDRVKAISLPTIYNSSETKSDATELAQNLGIEYREVPIQEAYEATLSCMKEAIEMDPTSDQRVSQNLQARIRMMIIMGYAQAWGGIMINTGNKTERFTNNFTIYADSAGAIAPLADVDKDRVYELARYMNELIKSFDNISGIPQSIIDREASAELAFNQVDANVMGGRPEQIAPFISQIIEEGINDKMTALEQLPSEVGEPLISRWMRSISASEWKGRQITPATRITKTAAGFNRRIPINHRWRGQFPANVN